MQFGQLRRREFLTISGSAAVAWPVAALSQETKVRRIGALIFEIEDAQSFRTELREELRKLGYVEGRNILFEFRSAEEKIDRLPTLAAELVADKVDVIVALYTPCGLAAQRATREIPIVVVSGDPVETGLVASLNRPGGNITGVSQLAAECHGKCVELFRDMLPTARRIAALGADAVVVIGGLATRNSADLALEHRLPAATFTRAFAEVGGLMSYGPFGPELFRRSAVFVSKILQGGKPSDMPIEQPTKFELVINLKTAKALGLTIPETLLLRADKVIE